MRNLLLVGHRGAPKDSPENTILSFRRAFELGANAVEFDIRQAKDGEIVLMHDARLLRMARRMSKVRSLTLSQLRRIKIKKSEPIPTLGEALRVCAKAGGTAVVEFKEVGMEKTAVGLFSGSGRVIAISYLPEVLARLRILDPRINTGILFKRKIEDVDSFLAWAGMLKVDWLVMRASVLSPDLVSRAHRKGFKVMAWVLNRKKPMLKAIAMGVDGVQTNKPELFKSL